MFIKLHNVPADVESAPLASWVNSDHIIEMFEGEKRQFAQTEVGRIVQPGAPCTHISLSEGNSLQILETPDEIMALLNGPQQHGVSA